MLETTEEPETSNEYLEEIKILKEETIRRRKELNSARVILQETEERLIETEKQLHEINLQYKELVSKRNREREITKQLEFTNSLLMDNISHLRKLLEVEEKEKEKLQEQLSLSFSGSPSTSLSSSTSSISSSSPSTSNFPTFSLTSSFSNIGSGNKEDIEQKLQSEIDALKIQLTTEIGNKFQAQQQRDEIMAELEELTQALFQEANLMVSDEARARHEALKSKEQLQGQLEEAKNLLATESKSKERLRLKLIELAAKSSKTKEAEEKGSMITGQSQGIVGSDIKNRETFYMKRRSVGPMKSPRGSRIREARVSIDSQDEKNSTDFASIATLNVNNLAMALNGLSNNNNNNANSSPTSNNPNRTNLTMSGGSVVISSTNKKSNEFSKENMRRFPRNAFSNSSSTSTSTNPPQSESQGGTSEQKRLSKKKEKDNLENEIKYDKKTETPKEKEKEKEVEQKSIQKEKEKIEKETEIETEKDDKESSNNNNNKDLSRKHTLLGANVVRSRTNTSEHRKISPAKTKRVSPVSPLLPSTSTHSLSSSTHTPSISVSSSLPPSMLVSMDTPTTRRKMILKGQSAAYLFGEIPTTGRRSSIAYYDHPPTFKSVSPSNSTPRATNSSPRTSPSPLSSSPLTPVPSNSVTPTSTPDFESDYDSTTVSSPSSSVGTSTTTVTTQTTSTVITPTQSSEETSQPLLEQEKTPETKEEMDEEESDDDQGEEELDPKLIAIFLEIFTKPTPFSLLTSLDPLYDGSSEVFQHPHLQKIHIDEVLPCLRLSNEMAIPIEELEKKLKLNELPICFIKHTTSPQESQMISSAFDFFNTSTNLNLSNPINVEGSEQTLPICDFCQRQFHTTYKTNFTPYSPMDESEVSNDEPSVKTYLLCKFCKDRMEAVEEYFIFVREAREIIDIDNAEEVCDLFRDWLRVRVNMNVARIMVF